MSSGRRIAGTWEGESTEGEGTHVFPVSRGRNRFHGNWDWGRGMDGEDTMDSLVILLSHRFVGGS